MVFCAIRVIASGYVYKRVRVRDEINLDKEDDFGDFKASNAWRFLFPRLDPCDAYYAATLALLYGGALGVYLNPTTTSHLFSSNVASVWAVLAIIASAFNGYSLYSADVIEPANFNTANSKLFFFSTKHMRPAYVVLFALA